MADIQRWTFDGPPAYPYENGGYVTYANHLAAVAAAEQRGYNRGYDFGRRDTLDAAVGVSESHDAGVKAAREAVAAAMTKRGGYHSASEFSAVVLAAIDALQTRDEGRNTE